MTIQPEALCLYLNAMTKVEYRVPEVTGVTLGKRRGDGTSYKLPIGELKRVKYDSTRWYCIHSAEKGRGVNANAECRIMG